MTERITDTSLVSLNQQIKDLVDLLEDAQAGISTADLPRSVSFLLTKLTETVPSIQKQFQVISSEWQSLRALSEIGQLVNSSLELDEVLQNVMDTIIRLTGAERAFLMLRSETTGELAIDVARNWEQETLDTSESAVSRTVVNQVVQAGQAVLTTNAQADPRFGGQQSVLAQGLRSILCVPLKQKNRLIGVIYADNRIRSGLFTSRHLDMLTDFANQAAVALENARLFASVRRTLAEVTELKNLMDNVFSSIASGVITTDVEQKIVLCNRAAESILGSVQPNMVGSPLLDTLPGFVPSVQAQVRQVLDADETVTGLEVSSNFLQRGAVDLRLNLSPLKDGDDHTQGVTIVIEDLTEKKHLEAQRRLFERMVSPAVIDQLNPDSLQLGGNRMEITTLFADIRGFTHFSETLDPEDLVKILNRYLAVSADAVLRETGTIDKFLGDAVMAWFNAPMPQPDHALRAVRSALGMRDAIHQLHQEMPPEFHLQFGAGIHTGDAVLGLIGTERRLDYTAIGDSVNTAKRIQENAGPGQILISRAAYAYVEDCIEVRPVEPIHAKGKREPVAVYEVLGLR